MLQAKLLALEAKLSIGLKRTYKFTMLKWIRVRDYIILN